MSEVFEDPRFTEFLNFYLTLDESEKFKLSGVFTQITGGKLSPYNSPTPVAVSLIQIKIDDEIKLLGVRRGIHPKLGEIALPGGFVNTLEQLSVAAQRETEEETGLKTEIKDYKYLDSQTVASNNLLIFLKNEVIYPVSIMDKLILNSEVTEFVLIDKDTPIAFPLHKQIIDEFFNELQPIKKLKMK